MPYIVRTEREERAYLRKHLWSIAALFFLLGAGAALVIVKIASDALAVEVVNIAVEKGCRAPTREGEITTWAILDGKSICWRMY